MFRACCAASPLAAGRCPRPARARRGCRISDRTGGATATRKGSSRTTCQRARVNRLRVNRFRVTRPVLPSRRAGVAACGRDRRCRGERRVGGARGDREPEGRAHDLVVRVRTDAELRVGDSHAGFRIDDARPRARGVVGDRRPPARDAVPLPGRRAERARHGVRPQPRPDDRGAGRPGPGARASRAGAAANLRIPASSVARGPGAATLPASLDCLVFRRLSPRLA